nr:microtubule-associated protein RP/EB family member 1C [Ipomoea batatas]
MQWMKRYCDSISGGATHRCAVTMLWREERPARVEEKRPRICCTATFCQDCSSCHQACRPHNGRRNDVTNSSSATNPSGKTSIDLLQAEAALSTLKQKRLHMNRTEDANVLWALFPSAGEEANENLVCLSE